MTDAEIAACWEPAFALLEREGPEALEPRQAAGIYAVASICYYRYAYSPVSDERFDELCRYLLEDLEAVRRSGADKLDEDLLRAGSGYDLSTFVEPYHRIALAVASEARRSRGGLRVVQGGRR